MRELRPLRLPQLVEARKKEEEDMSLDSPAISHTLQLSQSSTSSDYPSPTTPTFIAKGHGRFPSSNSSLASSPVMHESMDGFGAGKRPLTEVKEEPQERDESYEMINSFSSSPPGHDDDVFAEVMPSNFPIQHGDLKPSPSYYDLTDDHPIEYDYGPKLAIKRRRGDDFSFAGFTQRFGSRMPSLSRNWRQKKAANINISTDGLQDRPSRANSTRAPSVANSFVEMDAQDYPPPPTPAMSASGHHGADSPTAPIDIKSANSHEEDCDPEAKASTPLLPPVMADLPNYAKETPYQSPLQSPAVADRESVFSAPQSPVETPQAPSLPSPPLSTKPSISSFHRQRGLSYTNLTPTADIPPLPIAPTMDQDPWADDLGHANFTITPVPYIPKVFDVEACKQLRTDWETARRNFTRHVMRISEHYGATSKIHKLTEQKWAAIDAEWKRNTDTCISRTAENGFEEALSQSQQSVAEPAPLIKVPSLNGPKSEGKFPKLGDEGIVGPMEVAVSSIQQQHPRKPGKRSFFRFLQGMFTPTSVGLFGRPPGRRAATL